MLKRIIRLYRHDREDGLYGLFALGVISRTGLSVGWDGWREFYVIVVQNRRSNWRSGAMVKVELCEQVVEVRIVSDGVTAVVLVFEEVVLMLTCWYAP